MERKISHMMNEINLEFLENLQDEKWNFDVDIDEEVYKDYNFSKAQSKKLCMDVMNRTKIKSFKRKKKSRYLLIAAALVLGLGSTLWAVKKSSLVKNVFIDNKENLNQSGYMLDASDEQEGIRFTVKGVVGYEGRIALVYDVEKVNGEAFKGNSLEIQGTLEVSNKEKKAIYYLDTGKGEENMMEHTPYKREYVQVIYNDDENIVYLTEDGGKVQEKRGGNVKDFKDKEARLVINHITELYDSDEIPEIDLLPYIKEVPKEECIPFDVDKYHASVRTKKQEDKIDVILPYRGMNLVPYQLKSRFTIDNIGIINHQLHVRLVGKYNPNEDEKTFSAGQEGYYFRVKDKNRENQIAYSYRLNQPKESGTEEMYEIFDLPSSGKIENLQLIAHIQKVVKEIEAQWQIDFDMNVGMEAKEIESNRWIENEGENWQLKKIKLGNIYCQMVLEGKDQRTGKAIETSDGKVRKVIKSLNSKGVV